ncbi:MAG: ABC transporter permease [Dehalococcoidia bacterium]|nr:ABC transporter permease [Dehalococcoidia bacterium]
MEERNIAGQIRLGAPLGQRLQRWRGGALRFFRRQPLGAFGLVICLVTVLMGVFAPAIQRHDPNFADVSLRLQAPSAQYWFGTDNLGRDQWARIVTGTRISLTVAFFAIGLGTTAGYLTGIVSGYFGGKLDLIIQRFIDALLAFPAILFALVIVAALGAGIDKVIFAISVGTFPRAARISRGVVLSAKENVYVDAARVIGASNLRIMLRHILPNSMAPYLILASVGLGGAILAEASLSYLGLGVPPPHASWGRMLSGSTQQYALIAPWLMIFPGVAIMVLVLAFNLFGDAVRDMWDPKLRGR